MLLWLIVVLFITLILLQPSEFAASFELAKRDVSEAVSRTASLVHGVGERVSVLEQTVGQHWLRVSLEGSVRECEELASRSHDQLSACAGDDARLLHELCLLQEGLWQSALLLLFRVGVRLFPWPNFMIKSQIVFVSCLFCLVLFLRCNTMSRSFTKFT